MNTILFNQIKEQVLLEPQLVDMKFFCKLSEDKKLCNTTGCIGGWAMFLAGLKRMVVKFYGSEDADLDHDRIAAALLGISQREARELFYFYAKDGNEESPYHELAVELSHKRIGSLPYAKVVVKAIDLCMKRCEEGDAYSD